MTEQANAATEQRPEFSIQRIYIKDMSFESPNSPAVFQSQWQPQVNMDLNTRSQKLGDDIYEVVLSLTVTAKNDDKTAFLIEVQQAGIFKVAGMPVPALHQTLGAFCPNILFPYAREAIDASVVKGGFPALQLNPVNFDAVYQQAMARQAEQAAQEKAAAEQTH